MSAKDIRNIVLLGHGGSGKTTLAESMLFMTGGTDRFGKVTDGNTTCDYDAEEIKRNISISLAVAPVKYKNVKINVLDTPGNFDFAGEVLSGTVTDVVKGGILAVTEGVKVFIPASLSGVSKNEPLEQLLKQKVDFVIREVNEKRHRAVGSIKDVLKEQKKVLEDKFWSEVEVGKRYQGVVKSITSYGAFVDLGGVDGMVHISELSWLRIKHPSDVVKVGDVLDVYVKDIDVENKKISLGYKKTEDNPWEVLKRDYEVGSVVTAKVVSMTAFGAFAQIIPGVDGLIHISQISNERINKPQDVLTIGQEVQVQITDIDFEKKRVSLSMKALLEDNAQEEAAEASEETAEVNE